MFLNKIRIIIVDDDSEWLEGLLNFFRTEIDIEVVGYASSSSDAINIIKKESIDVILLDINLNGDLLAGIEAISEIRKYCNAKIIMLTAFSDKNIILTAFEAGATHYFLKRNFVTLPQEIKNIMKNCSPTQFLSDEYVTLKKKTQLSLLTPSELEIFSLLVKGQTHGQVEILLNKSTNTIRNQISSILKKLGMKNCKEVSKKFGNQ
jgi:DNA-binding NarL/FixJ family response regulator